MKSISIIGRSDIGLSFAVCAAQRHHVSLIEPGAGSLSRFAPQDERTALVNLGQHVRAAIATEKLTISDIMTIADVHVIVHEIVCDRETKMDSTAIMHAVMHIATVLKKGDLVLIGTTMPLGTMDHVRIQLEAVSNLAVGHDFFLAYCPMPLIAESSTLAFAPHRWVIGGVDAASTGAAHEFIATITSERITTTGAAAAELLVLLEHSARDLHNAFAHQIARICEQLAILPGDIFSLLSQIPFFIHPPVYGSPDDRLVTNPSLLLERCGPHLSLLEQARTINQQRPAEIIKEVVHYAARSIMRNGASLTLIPRVVVLGLTSSPNGRELHRSPALALAKELARYEDLVELAVCDPHITGEQAREHGFTELITLNEVASFADIVLVLVAHDVFEPLLASLHASCKVFNVSTMAVSSQAAMQSIITEPHAAAGLGLSGQS